jgi:predicted DNA-binding protein (MmcQ/YjbR family)
MTTTKKASPELARAEESLARAAAAYPDVVEHGPWGHRAFKVRGKTFLFMHAEGDELSFSVKLPTSRATVLKLPQAEPTHYGLGKSGWVTFLFRKGNKVPLAAAKAWLHESFVAIAPKKLSAELGASKTAPRASKASRMKAAPATVRKKVAKTTVRKR